MSTERYSQNKFIMLCGLPGAGKTTLAKSLSYENTVWLSSDKIREELLKNILLRQCIYHGIHHIIMKAGMK